MGRKRRAITPLEGSAPGRGEMTSERQSIPKTLYGAWGGSPVVARFRSVLRGTDSRFWRSAARRSQSLVSRPIPAQRRCPWLAEVHRRIQVP